MTLSAHRELLIATHNAGKFRELLRLLTDLPLRLRSLAEFPAVSEVEETGATFTENALLKARLYARQTGLWTLADDSGLEVAALDGAPGIRSARYAGEAATDATRINRLLHELALTNDQDRRARFVCAIALFDPATHTSANFNGTCAGRIAHLPCGDNGFGYDPIFVPDGHNLSFGQLPDEIKQKISHRAQALASVRAHLSEILRHYSLTPLADAD